MRKPPTTRMSLHSEALGDPELKTFTCCHGKGLISHLSKHQEVTSKIMLEGMNHHLKRPFSAPFLSWEFKGKGTRRFPPPMPPLSLKEGGLFLRPKTGNPLKPASTSKGGNPSLPMIFPSSKAWHLHLQQCLTSSTFSLQLADGLESLPYPGWDGMVRDGGGLLFGGLGFMVTRRETRRILGDFKEKVLSERNVQRWIFWGVKISSFSFSKCLPFAIKHAPCSIYVTCWFPDFCRSLYCTPFKGSRFTIPKKVTKTCQEMMR